MDYLRWLLYKIYYWELYSKFHDKSIKSAIKSYKSAMKSVKLTSKSTTLSNIVYSKRYKSNNYTANNAKCHAELSNKALLILMLQVSKKKTAKQAKLSNNLLKRLYILRKI